MAETTTKSTDLVRSFLLDPDTSVEVCCPECGEFTCISGGSVFQGSDEVPLGHDDPVLGDLIDAATSHKCPDGDDDARAPVPATADDRPVTGLTTLQFAWGRLVDAVPADEFIHLLRAVAGGGTPGPADFAMAEQDEPDARYFASWHPLVALAVADWLDRFADPVYCYGPAEFDHASRIARAYLGTAEVTGG